MLCSGSAASKLDGAETWNSMRSANSSLPHVSSGASGQYAVGVKVGDSVGECVGENVGKYVGDSDGENLLNKREKGDGVRHQSGGKGGSWDEKEGVEGVCGIVWV